MCIRSRPASGQVPFSIWRSRRETELRSINLLIGLTREVPITAAPKAYPEYGGDYYAVFFAGPESLRLELVHLTEQD
jgi:glyoxylase I family protein